MPGLLNRAATGIRNIVDDPHSFNRLLTDLDLVLEGESISGRGGLG